MARQLEAALFTQAEPVTAEQISLWLQIPVADVPEVVSTLAAWLQDQHSGLAVRLADNRYALATAADLHEFLEDRLRLAAPEPLSASAWEVLAVVAYRQPITRLEIESVRQTNSERALETLLTRELVEQVGRKEAPGRPILYGTTGRFLREFGLTSLEVLPPRILP
jgi:segregation and condensation protein B